jgi:hypothetical protein
MPKFEMVFGEKDHKKVAPALSEKRNSEPVLLFCDPG